MNTSSKRQADRDGHAPSRHAVVLGGSLAGLLAAQVLTDHFDEVTLIERDVLAITTEVRRGIPQANHVHGLLLRGREVVTLSVRKSWPEKFLLFGDAVCCFQSGLRAGHDNRCAWRTHASKYST